MPNTAVSAVQFVLTTSQAPPSAFLAGLVSFHRGIRTIRIRRAMAAISLSSMQRMVKFMSHHLVAWRESIAQTVENDLTPVPDQVMAIQNSHFVPSVATAIIMAYCSSVNLTLARLISPKFRQITTPYIRPTGAALLPISRPPIMDLRNNPLIANAFEELQLNATQTGAGAEVVTALGWLQKGIRSPAPQGDIFTMRGTGTTTVTAGAWSLCPITWADSLPNGNYAVVGMSFVSTTGQAARLILNNQMDRPGCIGLATDGLIPPYQCLMGGLGTWGTFQSNVMPQVEVLCNATDTAQEVFIDIVRIA